jgi:16S rRNA (cytosine967-C5)-methyltransferase
MHEQHTGTDLRVLAVYELNRIEQGGAYSGLSRRYDSTDPRLERRLTDLVSGVTRHRRRLDFLIASFYTGSMDSMDADVRTILRIGIYELLETQTPVHAAVNECVEAGKRIVGRRVGGLINGLLRSVDRKRESLPQPETGDKIVDMAIRHSHPDWMVRRWVSRYGLKDAVHFLEYNNERPIYGLRIRRPDDDETRELLMSSEIEGGQSPHFVDFVRVQRMQPVFNSGLMEEGRVFVQDEGAGGVIQVLDPQTDEHILDLCAAPGGKAIAMADRVGRGGLITAVDIHPSRLEMLRLEANRLDLTQIETYAMNASDMDFSEEFKMYDRVLVDAPCSGLGVLSKRADLRWRKSEEDIASLAVLQHDLLQSAARHVRPGGILVYSTCTTEPEENEDVATLFLQENPIFVRESVPGSVPPSMVTTEGSYQSIPFRDKIDGAFAVRFKRMEGV